MKGRLLILKIRKGPRLRPVDTVACRFILILKNNQIQLLSYKMSHFLTKSLCFPSPLLSTPLVELAARAESLMITTLPVNRVSIVQVVVPVQ